MTIPLLPEFQFAEPYLLGLLALPVILIVLRGKRKRPASIDFPSVVHFGNALKKQNRGFLSPSSLLLPLTMACGIVALARPQKITHSEVIEGEGVEISVAIDVSGSMRERDFVVDRRRVDRLSAAKAVVKEFIRGRTYDRIGVIVFSGRPHTMGPLTMNLSLIHI